MTHGSLPPVPVLFLPIDVVSDAISNGEAETSRNPASEFAAGDWWQGYLMFSGGVGSAITIVGTSRAAVRKVARRLHDWNQKRLDGASSNSGIQTKQTTLTYRTERGFSQLNLNDKSSLEEVTKWFVGAYEVLERDSQNCTPPAVINPGQSRRKGSKGESGSGDSDDQSRK